MFFEIRLFHLYLSFSPIFPSKGQAEGTFNAHRIHHRSTERKHSSSSSASSGKPMQSYGTPQLCMAPEGNNYSCIFWTDF